MRYLSLAILLLITSCTVQKNLSKANQLAEGMTKDEVKAIMGDPIKTDFFKNYEEWHYCKAGNITYEYIALFFYEGKLIAKKNYSVMTDMDHGVCGPCGQFVKMGNYTEPTEINEVRLR